MKIILFAALLAFPFLAMGQTVSGKVSSADGMPLKGVKVVAEGTTQGTMTDAQGAYTLKVRDGAGISVIVFTSKDYKKPMEVKLPSGVMTDTQIYITMDKKKKKRNIVITN